LTREDASHTSLRVFELTPDEERALAALRAMAMKEDWAKAQDFMPLENAAYRSSAGLTVVLAASIEAVQDVLAKAMKPARSLLSAVVFEGGRVEEIHADAAENTEKDVKAEKGEGAKKEDVPKAAATVAAPTIGCPVPAFSEAEIRATRVLEAFLSPDQLADYRQHGAFVTRGATTGHRYRVTHRNVHRSMTMVSFRSLWDLDEDRALCVHDWSVPAPEEMLALHLCVALPGKEAYVRSLPETWLP
jgi:hypothetical protein